MGHQRQDTFVVNVEWAKHLRPFRKRKMNKKERLAAKHRIEIGEEK